MKLAHLWLGIVGLSVWLGGRAVEGSEAGTTVPPAAAAPAAGSLRGAITVDGKTEFRRIKIADAVVSLSGERLAQASPPAPTEPAVVDQKDITYVPHVQVVRAGTPVEFRNSDNTLHNVHGSCCKNNAFNLAMAPAQKLQKTFDKPEIVPLTCNVHAEMSAYVVVVDNAFVARPAAEGTYRIAGIPPGTYKVRVWHEALAPVTQEVVVKAGEETELNLNFDGRKRPVR